MRDIPFLINHDPTKPIGVWKRDGIGEFNADQRITKEMLFEILGGAGVKILESFDDVQGTKYIRAFEISEFSLCTDPNKPVSQAEKIIDAQNQIAKILHQLEQDTGEKIDSIDINDVDVTTMDSHCTHYQSSVRIRFQRVFVRDWS